MKRMCLAALTGALAISTMAVAIDDASAATRGGAYRGGAYRGVGVGRVGVGRAGLGYGRAGIGYGRAGIGYGRAGVGYGGAALAYSGGWNGDGYASADDGASDAYTLNGAYMSESDAVAYCAQHFRSYDVESRTFVAYNGERVSCPQ
jgi:BA14K-like protein